MTLKKIYGVCPHDCPDTCGLVTEVDAQGQAVKLYGDPDHPITQGWLCAKVRPYLDHVYHPDRLTHPLRRVGPKKSGQWARISWAEAIDEITSRWKTIIAEYGGAAILPYSYSGTLGLVQMEVSSARLWNRMGASGLIRSICGEAGRYAVERTLGQLWGIPFEQVVHSKVIIVWGHNPVSTSPHFMPHLRRAQRNGTQLIVIDPRRTRTAKGADWHIAPMPGTDGALALGMAYVIVHEGLHDEAWLTQNTVGWPELQARIQDYPPTRVAEITGLTVEAIERLARLYATHTPSLIKIADGIQRHQQGGQAVRAVCVLPALTGQYGVLGGGLSYSTSGYLPWDSEAVGHASECPPTPREVNMNRLGAALMGEINDPPIQSLFVFGANPMAATPNAGLIAQGLLRDDLFTVVHELFMTDTADYGDIILPATSQLEQADIHRAYGHTNVAYNHAAIAPLGEAKTNWEVMALLAEGMGYNEPWLKQSAEEVIAEVLDATAATVPTMQGYSVADFIEQGAQPMKLPSSVPFADLRFPTPSGKVELYSAAMAQAGLDPLPSWQDVAPDHVPPMSVPTAVRSTNQGPSSLQLLTGASHHFVTTSFGNQPNLMRREGQPFLEIHPDDAALRQISDGDLVQVENGRGWCKLTAVLTDAVRPGVVASPKGHWAKNDPHRNGDGGRNINWVTWDGVGDMASQSVYHATRVWVRKLTGESAIHH